MKRHILEKSKNELRATPTTYCLQIQDFKHLVERDNSDTKETAQRELAYVFHVVDPTSSYSSYRDEIRKERVKEHIFGEDTDWVEDGYVRKAMETYKDINLSETERLLKSAKKSAKTLREYFEQIDLTETDNNGKLKWKAKDLMQNLSRIGEVREGIKELERQVEKEHASQDKVRGGVELTQFNK